MTHLAILIGAAALYFGLRAVLLFGSQPLRRQLATIALDLLEEKSLKPAERHRLEWMIDSCMSSAVGLLMPVAALSTTAAFVLGAPKIATTVPNLQSDPRYRKLQLLYVLSIMACSPIAALVTIPIAIVGCLAQLARDGDLVESAEAPVLSASSQLQPC